MARVPPVSGTGPFPISAIPERAMAPALSQDSPPEPIWDHYAKETLPFQLWTAFARRLLQPLFRCARDRRRQTETTKTGREAAGMSTLAMTERVIEGTPYAAAQDRFFE